MQSKPRLVVIALDGFPYNLLKEVGPDMPNLSALMASGSWGKLESTVPFITATAWTSFMTGKNPGKHGVLGFLSRKADDPSDSGKLVAGFSFSEPTLWRCLSDAGVSVGILGVPMTYRPESVNGFVVSGFPLPRGAEDYTYPAALREELEGRGWDFSDVPTQAYSRSQLDSFYAELNERIKVKTDAVLYLLNSHPVDFFMVHYFEPDKVLHEYLNFRYAAFSSRGDHARYGGFVDGFMRNLDAELGRLLSALPPDTNVAIVSDHGLAPGNHVFLADTWLLKEGYLKVNSRASSVLRYLAFRLGLTPELGFRVLPGGVTGRMLESFNSDYWEMGKTPRRASLAPRLAYNLLLDKKKDIDWSRSLAYSFGGYGVLNIYLIKGKSSADEIERLKSEILEKLRTLSYKGDRIFDKVLLDNEVYSWRESRTDIPDMMAYDEESRFVVQTNPAFFTSNRVVTRKYANRAEANHDRGGIFVLSGPDFRRTDDRPLSIMDVFPMVLHYFGIPVDRDVDGRVPQELFREGSAPAARSPVYVETSKSKKQPEAFSSEEAEQIMENLRRMGYV